MEVGLLGKSLSALCKAVSCYTGHIITSCLSVFLPYFHGSFTLLRYTFNFCSWNETRINHQRKERWAAIILVSNHFWNELRGLEIYFYHFVYHVYTYSPLGLFQKGFGKRSPHNDWVTRWINKIWFPTRKMDFPLVHSIKAGSRAHTASVIMGTEYFRRCKSALVLAWPFIPSNAVLW